MRRPSRPALAAGTLAAVALSLSAAAPGFADETSASPTPSSTAGTDGSLPPADPLAPVVSTDDDLETSATPTSDTTSETTAVPSTESTPTEVPVEASATAAPGGNGAFSYPFVLTPGEGGSSTVAIEVAGSGVTVAYTLDEQGKVTDATIAAGDATVTKATPHMVRLTLATGETVKVFVHGDTVRVKVKPIKGGPLRPGIVTEEEAAEVESEESEAPEADETRTPEEAAAKEARESEKAAAKAERDAAKAQREADRDAAKAERGERGKSAGKGKGKGRS